LTYSGYVYYTRKKLKLVQPQAKITDRCYLDVKIDRDPYTDWEKPYRGRIVIGLYGDAVPKTCRNFKSLCEGYELKGNEHAPKNTHTNNANEKKNGPLGSLLSWLHVQPPPALVAKEESSATDSASSPTELLSYKGTTFHNIIPTSIVEGGDVVGDGKGRSIRYCSNDGTGTTASECDGSGNANATTTSPFFDDENYKINFAGPGTVGVRARSSIFFIQTGPADDLNGKHVAFGVGT